MILLALITIIVVIIMRLMGHIVNYNHDRTGGGDEGRMTYAIFGILAGLSREKLVAMLESHGARAVSTASSRATIVWSSQQADYKFDKRSFEMRCQVKNLLDVASHTIISNKEYLHLAMEKYLPHVYEQHFARTWRLNAFTFPELDSGSETGGAVFIVRPTTVGYFGGKGIARVSSRDELEAAREEYVKLGIADHVIVSEYLDDPYLFSKAQLKFHLRMYFMVRVVRGQRLFYELFGSHESSSSNHLAPRAKILTAARPFIHANYEDPEIHDTHAKSTAGAFFFPTHAREIMSPDGHELDINAVMAQLQVICDSLANLLGTGRAIDKVPRRGTVTSLEVHGPVCPYSESVNGFEIFGLDIMIVKRHIHGGASGSHHPRLIDPCVVLLEVNDRVGYDTPPHPLFDEMQDAYFKWAWTNGIAPCL